MQMVRIETEYQEWINFSVVAAFERRGVEITPSARTMLAYVLQSQRGEGVELIRRRDSFLRDAVEVYGEIHGTQTMTVNRAIHLLVQTNQKSQLFPWGTSD